MGFHEINPPTSERVVYIIENNRYLLIDKNNVRWIIEWNVREIKKKKKIYFTCLSCELRGANVFSFDSSHYKPIVVCVFWKKYVDLKLLLDDPLTFFSKPTVFLHVQDICILFIRAWKQIRLSYSVKSKIVDILYICNYCSGAYVFGRPTCAYKMI